MKVISFLVLLSSLDLCAVGQRPALDTGILYHWPRIDDASITNDGQYVQYMLDNVPANGQMLVIKAVNGPWESRFAGASDNAVFTEDSHAAILSVTHDTVNLIRFGGFGR